MLNAIPLIMSSRLNGDSRGTYTSLISQYLRDLGTKYARERFVNFGEHTFLRAITEINNANLTLKEVCASAQLLLPYIKAVADGQLGDENNEVYAVDAWGEPAGEKIRRGFVCVGEKELLDCVSRMTRNGFANVKILSLSRLVAETYVGWCVALWGEDEAKRRLGESADKRPPELKAALLIQLEEIKRRLATREGERRLPPPANSNWERFDPQKLTA